MNPNLLNFIRNAIKSAIVAIILLIAFNSQAQTNPSITFTTTTTGNFNFELRASKPNTQVKVDWGNGKQISYVIGTDSTAVVCPTSLVNETEISIYGTDLVCLDVNDREITSIDVTKCLSLQSIYCSKNYLYDLDLSQNLELKYLYCDQNSLWLYGLDITQNTKLLGLVCRNNDLDELDLSNNAQLTTLDCAENNIFLLDVSMNSLLTKLYCSSNQLTSLDVSRNTKLVEFSCEYNFLQKLDLVNNLQLTNLNCSSNQLTDLDLSKNISLKKIDCSFNNLTIKTLPPVVSGYSEYVYSPQALISIPSTIKAADIIDLSSQLTAPDVKGNIQTTIFTWKYGNNQVLTENTEYSVKEPGKFLFQEKPSGVIYCEMKNHAFPDLKDANILKTNGIQPEGLLLPLAISLTTTLKTSISPSIKAAADYTPVKIENGNGEISYHIIGTTTSKLNISCGSSGNATIKIYGENIAYFNCTSCQLTKIDVSRANELTGLSCSYNNLTSINLSGNGKLDQFICYSNQLSNIDVSKNPLLTVLNCGKNSLTGLSLSTNPLLTELYCNSNQISTLNLSNNVKLSKLNCSGNKSISSLSINKNTVLKYLDCSYNDIRTLDVTSNTLLEYIDCSNNGLTFSALPQRRTSYKTYIYSPQDVYYNLSINVGGTVDLINQLSATDINGQLQSTVYTWKYANTVLKEGVDFNVVTPGKFLFLKVRSSLFYCEMTNVAFPDLTGADAMKFDIKMNPAITINTSCLKSFSIDLTSNVDNNFLIVDDGESSYYSLRNDINIPERTYASSIKIWGSGITKFKVFYESDLTTLSLDISNATSLTELDCNNNSNLKSLTITGNSTLQKFNCNKNKLSILDLSKFSALKDLYCIENQITSLDVSKNAELSNLYCSKNLITALDLSMNLKLDSLVCASNQLTALNVENNAQLKLLSCGYNNIESLDVGKNLLLTELYCGDNKLSILDVEKNSSLKNLECYKNQLTSLEFSKNPFLNYVWCSENQISQLDVSKNTSLSELYCYTNKLSSVDLSKNTGLKYLYCYNNQLTNLDVTKNTALTSLYCGTNKLASLDISKNTELKELGCNENSLNSLDVSKNLLLTAIRCQINQFETLDFSNNTELIFLSCRDNKLKEIDVTNNRKLAELYCYGNSLTFTRLPQVKAEYSKYQYAPQTAFSIPKSVEKNKTIDLSSLLTTNDINLKHQVTTYTWITNTGNRLTEGNDYRVPEPGIFVFLTSPSDSIYCEMSNSAFPDFKDNDIYKTTLTKISLPTEINEPHLSTEIRVYASGPTVYVRFTENPKNARITIYDMTGRLIISKVPEDVLTTIPVNKSGVYFVTVIDGYSRKVGKVIISE